MALSLSKHRATKKVLKYDWNDFGINPRIEMIYWQNMRVIWWSIIMNMNQVKLIFQFYRSTLVLNGCFSIVFSLILYLLGRVPIIYTFSLLLASLGFIVSMLVKESSFSNKDEYYFYYNVGISKIKLIIFSCLLNLALSLLIISGYSYARWIANRQYTKIIQ
jgi:hypothetical protein